MKSIKKEEGIFMATSTTTIRLDSELKKELTKELDVTGLSLNGYFNLAARQLVLQKKIPFEILTETDIPTEKTRRALVEAEAKELGILPDDSPSFTDMDDLKAFLDD